MMLRVLAMAVPVALALPVGCAPAHTPAQEIGEAARQYGWCAARYPSCLFYTPEQRLQLYLQDHPDGFELEPDPE